MTTEAPKNPEVRMRNKAVAYRTEIILNLGDHRINVIVICITAN